MTLNTYHPFRRLCLSLIILTLAGSTVALAESPPARKPVETKIPFDCFTEVWDGSFEVVSSRYDRPGNKIIWVLRAKKEVRLAAYEAFVADPDGVEVDTIKLEFTPKTAKVKAGSKLQAVLPLGLTAGEPAKITIRECR